MIDETKRDPSDVPEYDPRFHVTASELRAAGIPVPVEIPDAAWLLRSSIVPAVTVHDPTKAPPDVMSASLSLEFTAPFRWIGATVSIPAEATTPSIEEYPREVVCLNCKGVVAYAVGDVAPLGRILDSETVRPDGTRPEKFDPICTSCGGAVGGPFWLRDRASGEWVGDPPPDLGN